MPNDVNQTPEELARDRIDNRLQAAGWQVQDKDALDFNAGLGIAVREFQTDVGPADYVLFADRQAVGVVEAKPDSLGSQAHHGRRTIGRLREGEGSNGSRTPNPCPFSMRAPGRLRGSRTGAILSPRSREVFSFHRPETLNAWTLAPRSLPIGHRLACHR